MENLRYLASLWRFWLAVLVVGILAWILHMIVPRQHNPWRELSLADPIGYATSMKLSALKSDRQACFRALDEVGVKYTPLADEITGPGCGFRDALTLDQTLTPYSATVRLSCPMAATLYVWEAAVARPFAKDILGSEAVRIETFGAYSCRNIAGTRRRSEHARANAIDISGVRLADGRLVGIEDHWGEDTPEGEYLERLHDRACRLFSVTLGPDYNAAHADHFHMDLGSGTLCR